MNGTGAKLLTVICVSTSSQIAQFYRTVTLIRGLWHHLLVSGGFVYSQITRGDPLLSRGVSLCGPIDRRNNSSLEGPALASQ